MLNKSEQMLFALLRASLHNCATDTGSFENVSNDDWVSCYKLATVQGVLALAWEGVLSLPVELQPYKQLKFQWAMSVDKYEAKHRKYCSAAQELQQFYSKHGIVAVQMKGVGFSSYYNCPSHREGGDIDIFTYSADTSKMSHEQAYELSNKLIEHIGINVDEEHSYKHSNFFYKGIPIENHKLFLNTIINPKLLGFLNNLCRKYLDPKYVAFYDGEFKILVPSDIFNTIFIPCHAFLHYGSGIALHHLYDWAVLLNKCGLNMPSEITDVHFLRSIAAFTHLSNLYLKTDIKLDTLPKGYKELSDDIFEEMLYPKFTKRTPYANLVMSFIYKCRKLLRSSKLAHDVFGSTILARIKDSAIQKLNIK